MMIAIIVAVAVIAVLVIVLLSSNSGVTVQQYDTIPQSRLPDGGFVIGNPDAPVTLVEFADYSCPACQNYLPVMDRFFEEFVKTGKAKFEYRVLPTHGGMMTQFNGTIATCLENQKPGAFWAAKDLLFQSAMRGVYDENTARQTATQLGLDYNTALACAATEDQVNTDVSLAQSLGANATPSVRVRYGDSAPQVITYNGQSYASGGAPYEAIVAAMLAGGVT
jgi:protein-disulfide isomerase